MAIFDGNSVSNDLIRVKLLSWKGIEADVLTSNISLELRYDEELALLSPYGGYLTPAGIR